MKIKGFLFDVDGVLYDTMPVHAKSWVAAFLHLGMKVEVKSVYEAEGMPSPKVAAYIASTINKKLSAEQLKEIVIKKRALFGSYKNPKLIKGAAQLVAYLQKRGFKIGLVTGTTQPNTILRIKGDFKIIRSNIIGGLETKHSKPHPQPFLEGLKRLKLSSREAIVVENAPLGIRSAKNAKIKCVALTTGPISKKELKQEQADWVFKNCAEMLENIEKILV